MLQNTPTVYLSRLASPSLQRFLQSNGFQLTLSTYLAFIRRFLPMRISCCASWDFGKRRRSFTEIRKN